jgi:hypothetical protein
LLDGRGRRVAGWRTRPSRYDPEGIEHAAVVLAA